MSSCGLRLLGAHAFMLPVRSGRDRFQQLVDIFEMRVKHLDRPHCTVKHRLDCRILCGPVVVGELMGQERPSDLDRLRQTNDFLKQVAIGFGGRVTKPIVVESMLIIVLGLLPAVLLGLDARVTKRKVL